MIHFGIKRFAYSVEISSNNWFYGENECEKLFKISFWNDSIMVSYMPSQTQIDSFDLFLIRKQDGFKSIDHFGTIHANRKYIFKLKLRRIEEAIYVDISEDNFIKIHHADRFKYPIPSFGFLTKGKNKNILINKIEDE